MKYRSLINAYDQLEAEYPDGESFGVKKGSIKVDGPVAHGWFRVIEENPECYRSVAYVNGGVRKTNAVASLRSIEPILIKSSESLRLGFEYCNAIRFLGSLTEINGQSGDIAVAGLLILGAQRESVLRVIQPHQIVDLFPLQQLAPQI